MQISRFAWSFFLVLLLLAGLLVVNFPQVSRAVSDNLSALAFLREWGRTSPHLSQTICPQGDQLEVSVPEVSQKSLILEARRAYFAGDCELALAYWSQVLEADPQNETAAIMRFLSSGLNREMLPEQISTSDMALFLRGLGLSSEQEQQTAQVEHWFAGAFAIEPSSVAADRLIGIQKDESEQTAIWGQLAGALSDDDPDYWWAVGQSAEISQDWNHAAEAYDIGSKISSEPYDFLISHGKALANLSAWEDAIDSFQQASAVKPLSIEPYLEIGNIYRRQQDFDDAAAAYEQALVLAPDSFPANYFAGLTYFRLEDDQRAQQLLRHALELKPEHADTAHILAQSLNRVGEAQPAREMLEYAVGLQKEKSWNWLKTLGDWRYTDGNIDGALSAYEEALEIQPSNRELQNRLNELKGTR